MYTKHNHFSQIKILCCNQASQQNVVNFKFCKMLLPKIPHGDFEKLAGM